MTAATVMTAQEVANRLVELCRTGQIETAQTELYAEDCTSKEPAGAPMSDVQGLEAIKEKGKFFSAMIEEFHGAEISDPLVSGNSFAISWKMDVTMKGHGRSQMDEICAYTIKNGKITTEQFFY